MANDVVWLPGLCGTYSPEYAFWDDALSVNTSTPDLTVCFQKTVLLWVPCGWLWVCALFYYLYHLHRRPTRNSLWDFSWINMAKTGLCLLICFDIILSLGLEASTPSPQPVDSLYEAIRLLTMVLATVIVRLEYMKGFHTHGITCTFWLLQFICDIIIFRSWILRRKYLDAAQNTLFIVYAVYFCLVTVLFILSTFADKEALRWGSRSKSSSEGIPLINMFEKASPDERAHDLVDLDDKCTTPERYCSFWMRFTYLWMTIPIVKGYWTVVTAASVYHLEPGNMCYRLLPKFFKRYNKGRQPYSEDTAPGSQRASFSWSVFWSGGHLAIPSLIAYTISDITRFGQVLIFGELVQYTGRDDPFTWKGLLFAFSLLLNGILTTLFYNLFGQLNLKAGIRAKSTVSAVVYRKALRLSGNAKKNIPDGEILNLMSVDAKRIEDMYQYGIAVYAIVLKLLMATPLMWNLMGPAVMTGIGFLLLAVVANWYLALSLIKKLQVKQMEYKDIRIKLTSEILNGIKIIKLYSWELPFLEKVVSARTKELYYMKLSNICDSLTNTFWFLMPYLVSIMIFATYVLYSPLNVLTPYKAFVIISLINIVSQFTVALPYCCSICAQAMVSFSRLSDFMELEERQEGVVVKDPSMSDAVSLENITLSWEKDGQAILSNMNMAVPRGELVAVVGHVGAGKTSFLSSILGEMNVVHGRIQINGSIAYVPQQAWIRNSSVIDNVIFGKRYIGTKFDNVLEATALLNDMSMLSDGEMTEIGEKGINLSGGQRQRVSLARAVYQDADIYLLDDPLSAVDAHVGKHIFDNVFSNDQGVLRHKTRILVTHSISVLPYVDRIVVIKNGVISEMGSYKELTQKQGDFAEVLQNYGNGVSQEQSQTKEKISIDENDNSELLAAPETKLNEKIEKIENKPNKLIEDENAEVGNVGMKVIWTYIKAGGLKAFTLFLIAIVGFVISLLLTALWVSDWSEDKPNVNGTMNQNKVHYRLGVYGGLGIGQALFSGIIQMVFAFGCVAASSNLHGKLLQQLIKAPMCFFDCTPLGRILNRCSADMNLIDSTMLNFLSRFIFALGPAIAIPILITYATPIFAVPCLVVGIVFLGIQRLYISYVRQLKRVASIACSPIYSHFDESIQGVTSIRAYGLLDEFILECDKRIDESQKAFYIGFMAPRWLSCIAEELGNVIVFFSALFVVIYRESLPDGLAALSVSNALNITRTCAFLIQMMTELESNMVAVERVEEYCYVAQEADWRIEETKPDKDWPREGGIKMVGYSTRYRPGLDPVLKNVDCDISAGQKVGIVGRTGAGKSSLALGLVRIIEAIEGCITIDGVKIGGLGLHDLRSCLTVIPQDPVVFSGTLRYNLDPFSEYSEAEVWHSLEKAHLKDYVDSLPEGLDFECGKGGDSLSTGQRQLVCLARAILRKTKVLILDEATAAVDMETDALIQRTIRNIFADCTVLAIAHRLDTVLDYDRIMVINEGQVAEYDTPANLLSQEDSIFYSLAKEAGIK